MPEQGPDYSFPILAAILVIVWVLNVYVPVLLVRPMWGGIQMLLEAGDEVDTRPPPPPPHIALPIIATLVALGALGFGVYKLREQEEVGGRWLWITAASGIAFFWALVLIVMTSSSWHTYLMQYAGR